jgi:acyl dehydratase
VSDFARLARELASAASPSVRVAEFPVSGHAITTWCAAIGDDNPLYLPGPDQLAPVAMLQTWAAPRTAAGRRAQPTVHARVRALARSLGYSSVVATDYELVRRGPLRVGTLVTEHCWVEEVTEPKATRLGEGQFATIAFSVRDETGAEVGSVRARTFYYQPPAVPPAPAAPTSPELLERPEPVDVTTTLVVAGALASNDHEPVHHDPAVAHAQGLPDIIVSIVTTAGLVGGYAHSHWGHADPGHVRLRLAAPCFPGDVLTFSGDPEPGAKVRETVRVRATHARGTHCTAVVAPEPVG